VVAQAGPVKLKFGDDLPASHSVNVRLGEAIEAIGKETNGQLAISLFPNNQLGSDADMMSQLRSGALELATMPGTVLSTLIAATSLTGLGFVSCRRLPLTECGVEFRIPNSYTKFEFVQAPLGG